MTNDMDASRRAGERDALAASDAFHRCVEYGELTDVARDDLRAMVKKMAASAPPPERAAPTEAMMAHGRAVADYAQKVHDFAQGNAPASEAARALERVMASAAALAAPPRADEVPPCDNFTAIERYVCRHCGHVERVHAPRADGRAETEALLTEATIEAAAVELAQLDGFSWTWLSERGRNDYMRAARTVIAAALRATPAANTESDNGNPTA